MNDQNPYDPYYPQPQIIGYDEYGQPVYQQVPPQAQQPYDAYDPYAAQQQHAPQQHTSQHTQQQAYGYDAYGQPVQPQQQPQALRQPQQPQYDPYGQPQQQAQQQGYGYSSYDTGQQWAVQAETAPAPAAPSPAAPVAAPAGVPGQRSAPADDDGAREYRTEQFSFIEEPDEDSEDVIDWLKFTESRSERREEARRRGRNRVVALIVVLALAAVGGVGYLWSAGKLPGISGEEQKQNTATGPQKRDTIVVHLHDLKGGGTSTALLVDNTTTGQGTTVLLPNTLSVADDEGAGTTLAKSVEDDGSSGTREAIGNLLGTKITGTWRLDTPYLENLVEIVSNIDLTTDVTVPSDKKGEDPLVTKGENQTLNGRAAVAYATYRAPGEAEAKQLQRFGQVMYAVLRKMSDDPKANADTIATLVMILDPSLPEKDLGASLAKLAEHAKGGDYKTALLPVEQDGSLDEGAADSVVKDILGGKVTAPEQGAAVRVSLRDATGKDATEAARVVLVNGGFAFVGGADAETQKTSQVLYGDDDQKATAGEVAKTLGLPDSAVKKGKTSGSADVTAVLGQDYKIPGSKK
ncbi:LCP family protein [Streptomyces sp. Je 1-79]|uniref:LCP family protein n=1 Tax=Streptomyces sp. Je 1-79 TaxID=2943847 RepID=UPI0021A57D1B|nr:LCP family protein [Streptomyces sp. Je 1-79]MCT4352717.1 LCP family protein [Streptomyces sp. Je 1-79]